MIESDMFNSFIPTVLYILVPFIVILIIFSAIKSVLSASPKSMSNYKYQKRNLLTNNELNFYKSLYPIATRKGFIVFSKVRILDLIEPIKGSKNWQESKNKISQKHVDFVLCDSVKISPVLIIELDDSTHDRKDRRQRDKFVDQAFESAKIPILHTRTVDKLEDNIASKLSTKIPFANKS